jgi:hypothetical protein
MVAERYLTEALPMIEQAESTNSYSEGFRLAREATKRVMEARRADPNARIVMDGESHDCDSLAARILFVEGMMHIDQDKDSPEFIKPGIDLLKKYLNYRPRSIQAHMKLAVAYTRVYDRQNALAMAKKATELDPDDLDARNLYNQIHENPKMGTKEFASGSYGWISFILAPLGILSGIYLMFVASFGLGLTLALVGLGVWWWGARRQDKGVMDKALREQGIDFNERRL